jgi:glycosyltransferase involved in cell wall biosynthesis
LNKTWLGPRIVRIFAKTGFDVFERIALKRFDGIVVAVPDLRQTYTAMGQTIVIRNVPITTSTNPGNSADADDVLAKTTRFRVIYPGTLSRTRGVVAMISAMRYLNNDYSLLLVGDWRSPRLKEECESTPGWERVIHVPRTTHENVMIMIGQSDVGLQLPRDVTNYRLGSLPVKVLEYMVSRVPAIVSDTESKRRVLKDAVCYVDQQQPQKIAEAIVHLCENRSVRAEYVQRGFEYIKQNCWETESKKLIEFYDDLLTS